MSASRTILNQSEILIPRAEDNSVTFSSHTDNPCLRLSLPTHFTIWHPFSPIFFGHALIPPVLCIYRYLARS
ncbi:hypothetical protein BDV12DRAFT_132335 [Aspergillus spectabilis]